MMIKITIVRKIIKAIIILTKIRSKRTIITVIKITVTIIRAIIKK